MGLLKLNILKVMNGFYYVKNDNETKNKYMKILANISKLFYRISFIL